MRVSASVFAGAAALLLVIITLTPFVSRATTINANTTVGATANVVGAVSKTSGSFMIDHPLDPQNKLLYHFFVESPDVLNIYDGIVQLDAHGAAMIKLPNYFLALNKDFKYLATPIGSPMPDLYLSAGVAPKFLSIFGAPVLRIAGGEPNGKVSWQVTGIRHDPFILANPIVPEVEKGPDTLVNTNEYIYPEGYAK